ncbi:hypothetical protein lbkm_1815 [Lachnospiraceae bacterium KM106-2]|nr:hypothetical protein lbkm_1815 [Lachnospiraceae bacterium KM106-2]
MKKESSIKRLFIFAEQYKYLTISSWILSAISALIALIPFIYIWKIIDEVLRVAPDFENAENIGRYGWMAAIFSVVSMLIYIGALMCSHIAAFHVQEVIRTKAMHHIATLPMGFMDSIGSGKLRKTVMESSEATETYLAHQLPDRAGAIATPIGLLILLLTFDWRLGLLSLIPVVLAFLIMMRMTGKSMQKKMKEYQNSLDNMSNEAVEYIRGIPVVKTFGQSFFSFKRFKDSIDQYEKWVISYTKDLRLPLMGYTTAINATFAVLIAAAAYFTADGLTNEFLLNLIFYIIITPIITVTLNKIMYSSEEKMIVEDAMSRIDGIFEMKPLEEKSKGKNPRDNGIEINNLYFSYPQNTKNAINGITMKIRPGEHVAFVGPSGGGKTTLANLIARFFDATKGDIKIGGVSIKDISKEELMNQVSFVFQDSKLLKMSLFDNVRMGKKDASREEVLKALKDAQCMDIIEKMPNGIDTVVGTKGVYLSGGEAQRISIARVMLKNTPVLILDEATAFADPDNETKVQEAFIKLGEGKTMIMIAHRLSTIVNADQIFVLKNGKVAERGSHKALLRKKGLFASMWNEYRKAVTWCIKNTDNVEGGEEKNEAYRKIDA